MSCLLFSAFLKHISGRLCSLSLHLLGGLGEVGEGLTALELGVLNDTWRRMLVLELITTDKKQSIPASASDEKLAVHWTKVLFSFSPEVTA